MHLVRRLAIVNGKPRTGKDSLITATIAALKRLEVHSHSVSTIDPVRELLRAAGFPVDKKGPAERRLLADVGAAVETYNGYRTNHAIKVMCEHVWAHAHDHEHMVGFVQVRELANIERLTARAVQEGFAVTRVKVVSVRGEEADNVADNDVDRMTADVIIHNNGTLEELAIQAHDLAVMLHGPNYRGA